MNAIDYVEESLLSDCQYPFRNHAKPRPRENVRYVAVACRLIKNRGRVGQVGSNSECGNDLTW